MIEFIQSNSLEYAGIMTAILGIFYSIKLQKIAWVWNFIASCIYGILFYEVGLYSDMELQGVFMAMAIYGFVQWNQPDQLWEVTKSRWPNILIGIGGSMIFGLASGYLHHKLSNVSLPFLDATLTGFSIWGTYLATKKKITYQIVSEQEADLKAGKISVSSPIGKGLLGKEIGDVAEVQVPAGVVKFKVEDITV